MICIHADEENVTNELWTNLLPELSVCTDGIIVDLTSPTTDAVWLGIVQNTKYQVGTQLVLHCDDPFSDT